MSSKFEKISFIIPCFNEEGNISACIAALARQYPDSEIVVVDDGSTDNSPRIIRKLSRDIDNITPVIFEKNRGKTEAVKEGIRVSKGECLILFDADISVSAEDIKPFYEAVVYDNIEFVYGSRFCLPSEYRAISRINSTGNKIAAGSLSFVTGLKITDVLCGTKAFKRRDFQGVVFKNRRWPDFDLFLHACKNNLSIKEVPLIYRCRRQGRSKMKFFDAFLFAADIFNAWRQLRGPYSRAGQQAGLRQ